MFDPRTYEAGVPYDTFRRLRAETPVAWIDEPAVLGWPAGPGYWAVTAHADVKAVLRDAATYSSAAGATQIRDYQPDDLAYVRRQMLNMDGREHARIRRLVSAAFTPRAVRALDEAIGQRAALLVAQVEDREEFDFVTDLAADLPVSTLAAVLGVPDSDRYLLYDWSNRVIGYQDDDYAASAVTDASTVSPMARAALGSRPSPDRDGRMPNPRSREGMPDLYAYAHALAVYKRRHPGADVMSLLLQAQDESGAISDEEFENLFWLFAVAGNETLRNGMPGAMSALLDHPDQYRRLIADPGLVPLAVEESLRWWPPVMHFRRTATCDISVAGVPIGAGDKVVVYHASANRDEKVFDRPDDFVVDRQPNDHVSFGYGPHFCLGAHLARSQMRALLFQVVTSLPELERAGPPVRLTSNFQNGLKHLLVRTT
ncbi:MAG: cytochrome P450 [Acidimicrobiales bacterium]